MPSSPNPPGNQWRIKEWFPELELPAQEKLRLYNEELQKFNRTLNLVSVKTLAFADVIHFADSIIACKAIHEDNTKIDRIFDLGSGNGFPGIVFALLYPKVQVVLVDGDQKKCEFMKHCVDALEMTNVQIMNTTIEGLEPGSVKYCMARGLGSISKSILMTRKTVPVGGVFYHLKGESWSAEVGEIPTQLCSVWAPALVIDYKLPIGPVRFAVVKTDKIA
ncbi:MAG: 16S rRNA (guanine(527)-N(7))-methyltransferase RsmG [Bdellovibrionaceae bacterium]|nr:16S rRNA (guanine(527)-N(7))-methyltransferase RsmG [Pseudobdellovibrionaceae bacterium]